VKTLIMRARLAVLAAGLFSTCLWQIDAFAADRFGVVGLTNQTDFTIKFYTKTGSNDWIFGTIAPGARLWYSHTYDFANENRSPVYSVRFDSDLRRSGGVQKNFWIVRPLQHRAAVGQSYDEGKKYAFVYDDGNRQFIDIVPLD
jgi:hypothetical protein